MTIRGAGCMGNPLVRFWEGQEYDWHMEEILWHRRESRRQTEKTNFFLSSGSLLSTRKYRRSRSIGNQLLGVPQFARRLVNSMIGQFNIIAGAGNIE